MIFLFFYPPESPTPQSKSVFTTFNTTLYWFYFICEPHPVVLRGYFWLYAQELHLTVLRGPYGDLGSNHSQLLARQLPYPLYYCSAPSFLISKSIYWSIIWIKRWVYFINNSLYVNTLMYIICSAHRTLLACRKLTSVSHSKTSSL